MIVAADSAGASATSEPRPLLALLCVAAWAGAASSAGPLGAWPALGGAALLLGAAVLLLDGASSRRILRPRLRLVVLGALAGGAMALATHLAYPPLSRVAPFVGQDAATLYSSFRLPPLGLAALALTPVILGEELVWRGVVQSALVERLGPKTGVAAAAALYALTLAPLGSPVLALAALVLGLGWGALRQATGSLVPALVAHLAWNFVVLLWLPLVAG